MKELKSKTQVELKKILHEKREALRNFRFATAGSKLKNVREGRVLRTSIAQILTILNTTKK